MTQRLISAIVISSISLLAACAGSQSGPVNSGIDVRLNPGPDPSEPRPEGVLHLKGIHNGVTADVPVAPLDPNRNVQRVWLPPGTYSVSFSPVTLEDSLDSLRNRAEAKILSPNPFVIEIREGQIRPLYVRAVGEGTPAAAAAARRSMAHR